MMIKLLDLCVVKWFPDSNQTIYPIANLIHSNHGASVYQIDITWYMDFYNIVNEETIE